MKIALYLDHDYFNDEDEDFKDIIKLAIDDFKMDKVIIVLSMNNELDINFQWQIISNIVFDYSSKNNYCVGISSIEKDLIPPYYKYATLHALKNKYCNDDVFILTDENTLNDIPTQ